MQTRLARTIGRVTAAVTVAAAAATVPAGVAAAAPATDPGPSACSPGQQRGTIEALPSTSEVANYTLTVMAEPGTSPCYLSGPPANMVFSLNGSPRAVDVAPTPEDGNAVQFGDGMPVTYDLHVPASDGPAQANQVTFNPGTPAGELPGDFTAYGPIGVDAGMTVGPAKPF
ncbi:hypothetical protein ACLFMI_02320 [Pseudonocardia nantongensis]|uniref:hypothetical protein n=1 Tax=Pseudonocardia nantongensis TaxID=1181885 RepID=UPI00397D0E56